VKRVAAWATFQELPGSVEPRPQPFPEQSIEVFRVMILYVRRGSPNIAKQGKDVLLELDRKVNDLMVRKHVIDPPHQLETILERIACRVVLVIGVVDIEFSGMALLVVDVELKSSYVFEQCLI